MTACQSIEKTNSEKPVAARVTPAGRAFAPAVDIVENADAWRLIADIPGAGPNDIDVQFENGLLTLRALVAPRQREDVRFTHREYGVGEFRRSFEIGEGIDGSRIIAKVSNGVLVIELPKAEKIKPKKIAVKAG